MIYICTTLTLFLKIQFSFLEVYGDGVRLLSRESVRLCLKHHLIHVVLLSVGQCCNVIGCCHLSKGAYRAGLPCNPCTQLTKHLERLRGREGGREGGGEIDLDNSDSSK